MTALDVDPTANTPGKTNTVDDRSATFQAVEGNAKEARSGEALLVTAYGVIWTILLLWLVSLWRKQSALNARIDDLDRAIDKAALKVEKPNLG